jgi:hypothetical protein
MREGLANSDAHPIKPPVFDDLYRLSDGVIADN